MFTHLNSAILPNVASKEIWDQCPIVKGNFWEAVDKVPLIAPLSFKDIEENNIATKLSFLKIILNEKVW